MMEDMMYVMYSPICILATYLLIIAGVDMAEKEYNNHYNNKISKKDKKALALKDAELDYSIAIEQQQKDWDNRFKEWEQSQNSNQHETLCVKGRR